MKAGFYECNITPPLGCYIWGYYGPHFGEDIDEELFAKAVVIEDDGEVAAFVAIDSCSIPADLHDIVTKRIFDYTGIEAERICISSVHTHKGASISDAPEINCWADKEFKDVCYRKIADAVTLAYKRMQDVTVSYDTVQVSGLAHNRTSILPNGRYRTWTADYTQEVAKLGSEDHTYTIMSFKADGKPIGSISSFPLHSDSTGHNSYLSGDYSSAISATLKEKFGSNFVSVFLLGTCGDINHIDHDVPSRPDYLHFHRFAGKKLAESAFDLIENGTPIGSGGVKVIKELVTFKKRIPTMEEALDELSYIKERCDWAKFFERNYFYYMATNTAEDEVKLYLQAIRIGDVCIHILPGEIFVDIGLAIKEGSPFEKTIVVENSNSYCGYVPTKKCFEKEHNYLYETSLANHSCLVPEAADQFIEKSIELAKKLK